MYQRRWSFRAIFVFETIEKFLQQHLRKSVYTKCPHSEKCKKASKSSKIALSLLMVDLAVRRLLRLSGVSAREVYAPFSNQVDII